MSSLEKVQKAQSGVYICSYLRACVIVVMCIYMRTYTCMYHRHYDPVLKYASVRMHICICIFVHGACAPLIYEGRRCGHLRTRVRMLKCAKITEPNGDTHAICTLEVGLSLLVERNSSPLPCFGHRVPVDNTYCQATKNHGNVMVCFQLTWCCPIRWEANGGFSMLN